MKKAVYSLVLSEEVVAAVDRMAYTRGTSRSNFINQVLAETVGYVTPEHRMAEILQSLSEQMTGLFQLQTQASDGMLTIRSPLRYRYKPTIRYRVELYRQPEAALGVLAVSFRTQSQALLADADGFFRLWSQLEQANGSCAREDAVCTNGSWMRTFRMRQEVAMNPQQIGREMSAYIRMLDGALKTYFSLLPDTTAAASAVRAYYAQQLG